MGASPRLRVLLRFICIYTYSSFSLSHEHNDPAVLHLVFVIILGHPVTPSNSFKICLAGC